MLNRIICKVMFIVYLITLNLDGLKGLLLCGDLSALEEYSPDTMICCNKMIFERVDDHKRKRDCCSNTLYYTDVYNCVYGTLIKLNRPDPLSTSPNEPMKKVNIDGIVRSLYIAWQTYIRPTTQTENSGRQLEDST